MKKIDGIELYKKIKTRSTLTYKEEKHCPMILTIMADRNKGTMSAFCVEAEVGETTFYDWIKKFPLFQECYSLAKMYAKEEWESMGREISEESYIPGSGNHRFEHWRMIGWARFGVGKNSRIRLDLDNNASPNEHYKQLLEQASKGDFTAGEIKQLMEAVNVGLSAHQVFKLQQEIDQLKLNLSTINENSSGHNPFSN